jgi:hypothetical protein
VHHSDDTGLTGQLQRGDVTQARKRETRSRHWRAQWRVFRAPGWMPRSMCPVRAGKMPMRASMGRPDRVGLRTKRCAKAILGMLRWA